MLFDRKFNYDNVTIRSVTTGLVNLFNKQITLVNSRDDGSLQHVEIPFYYSLSGDERFLQDIFLNDNDNYLDSNTISVPSGYFRLNGLKTIKSDSLDSRYVRSEYLKEDEEGELKTYSSELWSIPISLFYDCEIICSSVIEQMKISEQIITSFYKNSPFYYSVNLVRIPAVAKIEETLSGERPIDFNFDSSSGDTNKISINFSIEVDTFIGYRDPDTEMFVGNTMKNGIVNSIIPKIK